jgi:putative heme-binding domain-containing protein
MPWFRYCVVTISGACVPLLLTALPAASQVLANPSNTEIAEGGRLFLKNCALCHGGDATGGRGPDLTRGFFRHATSDDQLLGVVQNGILGTGMPWTGLSDRKAGQLVAFIRSLSGGHGPVPGDPQKGRELFRGAGTCTTCHSVNGEGSRQGPDLSWVGWRRAPDYLRTALLDPNADVDPRWWTAQVTTVGGDAVGGILVDEDQFMVRLLDVNDDLHSLAKSELVEFERGKASKMPSFLGVLSEPDLDDIVAYLAGLRGGVTN